MDLFTVLPTLTPVAMDKIFEISLTVLASNLLLLLGYALGYPTVEIAQVKLSSNIQKTIYISKEASLLAPEISLPILSKIF